MSKKTMSAGVLCVLVLILFIGCPNTTPTTVVGPWKVHYDGSCTGGVSSTSGMFVYSNGTVEFLETNNQLSGTWTMTGNMLTLKVSAPGNPNVTLQATLSGNKLINGTFSGTGYSGCWTATKPQF